MTLPYQRYSTFAVVVLGIIAAVVAATRPSDARTTARSDAALGAAPSAMRAGNPPVCWHDYMSDYHCPDSTGARDFLVNASAVTSVTLTVATAKGASRSIKLSGQVDAIFLNRTATSEFLVRYYDATSPAKAEALRAALRRLPAP